MSEKRRYGKLFLMVETCEAATLYSKIHSPNVLACSSSIKDEKSYSYGNDGQIGVALIDRYTYFALDFLEKVQIDGNESLQDFFDFFQEKELGSTFHVRKDLFPWEADTVKVVDFFGYVVPVEIILEITENIPQMREFDEYGGICSTEDMKNENLESKNVKQKTIYQKSWKREFCTCLLIDIIIMLVVLASEDIIKITQILFSIIT
eukprot:TRINITY_DN2587_c0_g1_i6.p2 TRINITY_DN2587_c0_g1~~TRINITY_DN2587_c0_g1_i6.p2  ORF type:complete len:206 (-),score=25.89 TRINITY_DN2587_c0_g1_i6:116-733(-)